MKSHPFLICIFISTLILGTPDISYGRDVWVFDTKGIAVMKGCNSDFVGNINFCETFIGGVVYARMYIAEFNKPLFNFCINGTTLPQLRLVVGKWLKENPQELDKVGFELVLSALREYFPCDGSRKP